jgi:hypothetical protein
LPKGLRDCWDGNALSLKNDTIIPLWQMCILPVDSLKLANPRRSQSLVIITDNEIEHKNLLPAGWTGTDELTYLDAAQQRFPVRYGLYRYLP